MRSLERVWFNHNQLSGPVPAELGNFGEQLEWLDFQQNLRLAGPLPRELTRLTNLHRFEWGNTSLCSPQDEAFQAWLSRVPSWYGRGPACGAGIWMWPTSVGLDAPGDTVRLRVTVIGPDGYQVENPSLDWSSSDESVATVDDSGLVTAVANGYASITVASGGESGSASIAVGQGASMSAASVPASMFRSRGSSAPLRPLHAGRR